MMPYSRFRGLPGQVMYAGPGPVTGYADDPRHVDGPRPNPRAPQNPGWQRAAEEALWAPDFRVHLTWNLSGDEVVEVSRPNEGPTPRHMLDGARSLYAENTSA